MMQMKGAPWEPVPGREGIYIKSRIDMPIIKEPLVPVDTGL